MTLKHVKAARFYKLLLWTVLNYVHAIPEGVILKTVYIRVRAFTYSNTNKSWLSKALKLVLNKTVHALANLTPHDANLIQGIRKRRPGYSILDFFSTFGAQFVQLPFIAVCFVYSVYPCVLILTMKTLIQYWRNVYLN